MADHSVLDEFFWHCAAEAAYHDVRAEKAKGRLRRIKLHHFRVSPFRSYSFAAEGKDCKGSIEALMMTTEANVMSKSQEEAMEVPMSQYSCGNCAVDFADVNVQRAHMRSEWHVYNLKRKIVSLPAISESVYNDQIASQDVVKEGVDARLSCQTCQKSFGGSKQLERHCKAQKHAQHAIHLHETEEPLARPHADIDNDIGTADSAEESTGEADLESCLFCQVSSDNMSDNLSHMKLNHGLLIPNQEYLIDVGCLLSYLSLLITEFHECLSCGTVRSSSESIQHHMTSKGHCSINLDRTSTLHEFYEYPTGDDPQHPMTQYTTGQALRLTSGRAIGQRADIGSSRQRPSNRQRPSKDGFSQQLFVDEGTGVALVPSTAEARTSLRQTLQVRSGDIQSMIGITDVQKKALMAVEKKMNTLELRAKRQYERKLEKIGNKQKHFKNDVPGPKLG